MQIVQTDYKHTLSSLAYRFVTAKKKKKKRLGQKGRREKLRSAIT
jgi:hypothetical protein